MPRELLAFTGDDTGLVKRVRLSGTTGATHRYGTQARRGGVTCACWGPDGEDFVGAGLANGIVRFWRTEGTAATPEFTRSTGATELRPAVVGLHASGGGGAESSARVLACDAEGAVHAWRWGGGDCDEDPAEGTPMFGTGGAVSVATFDHAGERCVVGGRDRDFGLWDVGTMACAFRARNVLKDNLDLPVPVWVSGLRFVPDAPAQIVASTGFVQFRLRGEVRLYDVKAQRRPTTRSIAPLGEEAIQSIACSPDGRYVIAGSGSGGLARLDMRMNLKPVGSYKGAAGSIKRIEVHPTLPLVACASLDRHVRVYKLEGTGALVQKAYLKQRLSTLLFSSALPPSGTFNPESSPGPGPGPWPQPQPQPKP